MTNFVIFNKYDTTTNTSLPMNHLIKMLASTHLKRLQGYISNFMTSHSVIMTNFVIFNKYDTTTNNPLPRNHLIKIPASTYLERLYELCLKSYDITLGNYDKFCHFQQVRYHNKHSTSHEPFNEDSCIYLSIKTLRAMS